MEIQSLSVCVPAGCPNDCKFCVSKMHAEAYQNQIEKNIRFRDLYEKDYMKRLSFARDNGCNTVILTGDGEPLMNKGFLKDFAHWQNNMASPFKWVELQTSGVTLDDETLRFLRNTVGVSTISLSLSSLDSNDNAEINGTPESVKVLVEPLCREIKRYDFNLRLSLNLNSAFNDMDPGVLFNRVHALGADQLTLRRLYTHKDSPTVQNSWINEHPYRYVDALASVIESWGRPLEVLSFGATRYSVSSALSVVLDDDCMNTEVKSTLKYLVLRPNCKLYTKWDDKGSLLF